MDIGNNIRKLRELKNLTQEFMANELGCSQKTYSNIETSGNEIKVSVVESVARILRIDIKNIFELDTESILRNNSASLSINHSTDYSDKRAFDLYEKLIREKDERINDLLNAKKEK